MTFCSHRISLNSSKPFLSDSKWNKRRFHIQIPDVLVKNSIKMVKSHCLLVKSPSWIFWFAVALNIAPVFWLNQCLTMYFSALKSMFHPFFPMAESGNVWNPRVLRPQNLPLDQAGLPGLPDVRAVDSPVRLATCVEAKARLSASRRCLKWWKTRFRLPSGND